MIRKLAYDSREFWERFAPFGSGAALAKRFPKASGGLSRDGWTNCLQRNRQRFPDLAWRERVVGRHDTIRDDEWPEPVYSDDVDAEADPVAAEPVHVTLTTEEQVARDSEVVRLRQRNRELTVKYEHVIKTNNLHEAVLNAVAEYLPRYETESTVIHTPDLRHTPSTEDAILGWADWHAGERVDYEVMQGLNSYDPTIMCRRVQYTVDKTISLLFGSHSGSRFDRLYVFDLGDTVTGDLLEDNKATNALAVFESFAFAAAVKARALTELASHIPVVYICVPGNHGRRSAKMPWKQPTETADWLIGEMVALHVAGNERIECIIPKAWSAVVEVRGHNHFLNHGYAAAKGGAGGIPWYAYMRRDGKLTAIESTRGRQVRYRWYGHIHTQAEIPKMGGSGEQFVIGSLKGGDEYALNELGEYGEPVQKLVGAHDRFGVTFRYPLNVGSADDTPSRYEDLL